MRKKLKQLWHDPVWSKVIAFIIISTLTYAATVIYKLITGFLNEIPFSTILDSIIEIVSLSITLPLWIFIFLLAICLTAIYSILKEFLKQKSESTIIPEEVKPKELPIFHYGKDLHLFSARIGYAVPGIRNEVKWFNDKEAVKRLLILLNEPLTFSTEDKSGRITPLWWFRTGRSMYIEKFQRLSKNKCLMNYEELLIERIAVYKHSADYKNFVYVECKADSPTGAYSYSDEQFNKYKNDHGYFWEEVGLINGKFIKREEYDDGAAEIKGQVFDAHDAELRIRYLTNYNFLISPNDSPFNSHKFDAESKDFLDGLLNGEKEFDDFFNFLMTFKRNEE